MRDTEKEAETQAERGEQALGKEPDVGLGPGNPGSRPEPKADIQPLGHPGVPTSLKFCSAKESRGIQLPLGSAWNFVNFRIDLDLSKRLLDLIFHPGLQCPV